jgi:curved DNA-binding protein CbpA
MAQKDYYAILGVPPTASEAEIRDAYRRLVRHYHPDLNPEREDAEARIKELNEAYEVLSDPARRTRYDRTRPVRIPVRVGGAPPSHHARSAPLDLSATGRRPYPAASATHVDLSGYGRTPAAARAAPTGRLEPWQGGAWAYEALAAELVETERLLLRRWHRLLAALLDW